ncbi:MAG: T9SS type A sorting domain-containing protein [Schleiferiaceae bacterium]|nr:T9SS type A sorting domain-containing protein [Schleiferiaceae bacterium]
MDALSQNHLEQQLLAERASTAQISIYNKQRVIGNLDILLNEILNTSVLISENPNNHPTMLWANYALRLLGDKIAYQEPVYLPNAINQKRRNPATAPRTTSQELVRVYPNPATNVVNILANGVVKGRVDVYTLNGQRLLQQEINFGIATMNVSALAQGMYVARIYADNDEELQTVKLVVGQ